MRAFKDATRHGRGELLLGLGWDVGRGPNEMDMGAKDRRHVTSHWHGLA